MAMPGDGRALPCSWVPPRSGAARQWLFSREDRKPARQGGASRWAARLRVPFPGHLAVGSHSCFYVWKVGKTRLF